jgi:hypothetical protein
MGVAIMLKILKIKLAIKANKNLKRVQQANNKKLGIFSPISLGLQEKDYK